MKYNLDALYKDYESLEFKTDFLALDKFINQYQNKKYEYTIKDLNEIIEIKENYTQTYQKLYSYSYLSKQIDTSNPVHTKYLEQISKKYSSHIKYFTEIEDYITSYPNLLEEIKNDEKLNQYAFYFFELLENKKYTLHKDVEEAISQMELSGSQAWRSMQQFLTSSITTSFNGKEVTLSEIRNYAYDHNPEIRKNAFLCELEMYNQIKDSVAFSINNIKSTAITINKLRGIPSVLDQTLSQSRIKKETLDALLSSIEKYLPVFRKYLKHKASLLGHKNGLPFYDLFATFETNTKKYSIEESKQFLLKHFATFSDDLYQLTKRAYEENWIDFKPRKGKVGGAFCNNLRMIKQSRILTNYDETLSDIVTLAHELGHAYHGLHIENHLPLNQSYTMPVAETASIFNENIILNAALKEASDEEKIFLIESQLQDATQIIVDIYSRFLFEKEVYERRENSFLFADDLAEIMKNAQLKAYGDALDPTTLHPYMWINKPHYYYTNLSFYNFPYAFGGLFAKGLYTIYEKNKDNFVEDYQKLLQATTVNKVEDVAKIMNIDLTKSDFWEQSLQSFANQIDLFINLTKK